MKIAHITTVHPRNDTRVRLKECADLAERWKSDVCLLVRDNKGDSDLEGVRVIDIGKLGRGRLVRMVLGSFSMFKTLLKIKPQIIHFHDPELIPLGLVFRLLGKTVIYDVHESVPETIMKRKWIPRFIRKPVSLAVAMTEKLSSRIFSRIVVVTPAIAQRFPRESTVLVQNFPRVDELSLDDDHDYQSRPEDFVYVGGLTDERAAREMIEAIEILNRHRKSTMHIAGPVNPVALKEQLEEMSGWGAVKYYDWVDRKAMAKLLGKARAGLVLFHPTPNHIESQPNKLFEYMSAGIPVVASNFPFWCRIVEGENAGLVVDPESPQEIADALRWVLENPQDARKMGGNGRRAVIEKYNWKIESDKLIGMYEELLNENQTGLSA
ncbi:MAG: glycosyltransferase family 4 protein [Cyclobacteriaceae bacterium]|nr:glycosyltransferase family 4 protein [Cyclobacteriaceae bacterium]